MDHSTFAGFQANIGSSCSTQFIIFFWPSPRIHIVKKDGTSHAKAGSARLNMCISQQAVDYIIDSTTILRSSKMKYDTAIPQLSHHAANCSITQQTGATSDTRQCGTRQSFGSAVSSRVSPQLHVPELCWVCIHASMPTRLGVTTCVHGKH